MTRFRQDGVAHASLFYAVTAQGDSPMKHTHSDRLPKYRIILPLPALTCFLVRPQLLTLL
jgi:hypothetical protein